MSTAVASQSKPSPNGNASQPSAELSTALATKYLMSRDVFLATVRDMCFPANGKPTNSELASFLLVCHEQDMNPVLREIYAFPKKGGGIQVIMGVDGWLKIANRHPAFDGMTFQDAIGPDGKVFAIRATIYRKDRQFPIEVTEYLDECRRGTDPWKQMPLRMLRNRAICQAVRVAFGVSGVMNDDEFERWQEATTITVQASPPTRRVARSSLNERLITHAAGAAEETPQRVPSRDYVSPDDTDPADWQQAEEQPQQNDPLDRLKAACSEAYEQGDLAAFSRLNDEWCGPEARWTEDPDHFADAGKMIAEWRDKLTSSPSARSGKRAQKTAFETSASASEAGH